MKLTTGYKKPVILSGSNDTAESTNNDAYLLLAGGGTKNVNTLLERIEIINLE